MRCLMALLHLLGAAAAAGTATQDDWSGAPGVPGPVTDWGTDFYCDSGLDPFSSPGQLTIEGELAEHQVTASFDGAFSVDACDIDGDGWMDVLGGAMSDAGIAWWRNTDGSGTQWVQYGIGDMPMVRRAACGDIDSDGDCDVAACGDGGTVAWYENSEGTGHDWITRTVTQAGSDVYYVDCGDVDGDGRRDIVTAEYFNERIVWWRNVDGSGSSWEENIVDTGGGNPYFVQAIDLDLDGDTDIIASLFDLMTCCWWENTDGEGTSWTQHQIGSGIMDPRCLDPCDLDGDGDIDVIGTGYDEVLWWENTSGSGTAWDMHVIDGGFLGAHDVQGADLDGDGDQDVLTVSFNTEEILWWENLDGAGGSWSEHMLDGSFEDGCGVCAADMDGNGIPDPTGAAYLDDAIAWWNLSSYSDGFIESSILDTQDQPDWDMLTIDAELPGGTSVGCQLRCSENHELMGEWSDTLQPPAGLEGILEDGSRYLQYRIVMSTTDPSVTPSVDLISVSWDPLGVHGPLPGGISFRPAHNPSSGAVLLSIRTPEPFEACIRVFDVSGRLLGEKKEVLQAGTSQVSFLEIPPGVYLCTMGSGELLLNTRLVILE